MSTVAGYSWTILLLLITPSLSFSCLSSPFRPFFLLPSSACLLRFLLILLLPFCLSQSVSSNPHLSPSLIFSLSVAYFSFSPNSVYPLFCFRFLVVLFSIWLSLTPLSVCLSLPRPSLSLSHTRTSFFSFSDFLFRLSLSLGFTSFYPLLPSQYFFSLCLSTVSTLSAIVEEGLCV